MDNKVSFEVKLNFDYAPRLYLEAQAIGGFWWWGFGHLDDVD